MPVEEYVRVIDDEEPAPTRIPEVEVEGDEAVIRVIQREGTVEERRVKLPKTTWG